MKTVRFVAGLTIQPQQQPAFKTNPMHLLIHTFVIVSGMKRIGTLNTVVI